MSSILKVDEIQDTSGNNIINENANTITIGKSGDTVALASGATQSGFGLSGWSEDGANNNLLPASASAGIYLGVNSATAANLLDDYEEGSWTPSDASPAGLTYSNTSGNCFYTKIGNVVFASFRVTFPSTSDTNSASVGGFPFVASASPSVNTDAVSLGEQNLGAGTMAVMSRGSNSFLILTTNGSSVSVKTNANCSGKDFRGMAVYKV